MNIIDFFDCGASQHSERVCLTDGHHSLNYRETQAYTHRIGMALQANTIGDGSKVAVYSPNHINGFAAILGLYRAGASCIPVNARNPVHDNIDFLQTTGVDWLFYHSSFQAEAETMRHQLPDLRGAICIDANIDGKPGLEAWCQDYSGQLDPLPANPDRVAFYSATGGTTGKPKAVCMTDHNVETMIAGFLTAMPCEEPPVHLLVAPVTHAAGAVAYPQLAQGGTQVIMSDVDPEAIMQAIEQHHITHLFLPPTVIYMMLSHPNVRNYDYSSMKYFLYCAAPMSADKLKQAIDVFGPVMVQSFGQAEAPMMCTFMSVQDHIEALKQGNEHRLRSCGRATPFVRVAIMDDEGDLLPNNTEGEIVLRSSLVMSEYYNNPQATEESQQYGWHHTGDIGRIDEEGFVYIVDRKKDMIISGGFNIYPSEIEQVIWSHPSVQDCAVIGVPDEKWGEAVKAVIETIPDKTINEQEVIRLCKDKLGSIKAPKSVEVWESLPRSPVGKVLKKTIRQTFWEGCERTI
jgi:acyl-CoA synthetase (AMP-forming)/AMP-acid ligase II